MPTDTMNPNELRRLKAEKLADAKAIAAAAKAEGRPLTDEQYDRQEELLAEAEQLDAKAKGIEAREAESRERQRRIEALEADGGNRTNRSTSDDHNHTPGTVKVSAPEFTKDPMKGFRGHGDFLKAVAGHPANTSAKSARDERLKYLATAGTDEHQTGSDPYGGFLVPEGMAPGVATVADEGNVFTGAYSPTMITLDAPSFKVNAVVDKNHATSVTGGLTVSRRAETAAATSSRTKIEQVKFEATSRFGMGYATEEQLSDSPLAFASFIGSQFQREFTSSHVQELLRGTGVGEPEGIQNSPALVTVAKESGPQTADTIVGANLVKMRSRCWGYSDAIWVANHDTYPQLVSAHISGTNGDVFLYQPGRGIDVPDTLLGRPIFFSEYAETLGDLHDIMLINPKAIYYGIYKPLESAESVHVRFLNHERAYKFWMRDDARSLWRAPLTPNKSASTLSPFVTLATRA